MSQRILYVNSVLNCIIQTGRAREIKEGTSVKWCEQSWGLESLQDAGTATCVPHSDLTGRQDHPGRNSLNIN